MKLFYDSKAKIQKKEADQYALCWERHTSHLSYYDDYGTLAILTDEALDGMIEALRAMQGKRARICGNYSLPSLRNKGRVFFRKDTDNEYVLIWTGNAEFLARLNDSQLEEMIEALKRMKESPTYKADIYHFPVLRIPITG